MKLKKIFFVLILFLTLGILFSCKNKPIFYSIEQEVKLNKFSVSGNIVGIVKLDNKIYVATPEMIFSRPLNSREDLKKTDLPSGKLVQSLVTNGTVLFTCFYKGGVHFYQDNTWKKIPNSDSIKAVFGNSKIFGTDGKNVYEITTTGLGSPTAVTKTLVGAGGDYFALTNGLYKSSSNTPIVTTTHTPKNIRSACEGPSGSVFILSDKILYHYDGSQFTSIEIKNKLPLSIFYFEMKKTVLVACGKSYTEIKLDPTKNTLEGAKQIEPGASDSTTPPKTAIQFESAIGSYSINPIFGVDIGDGAYEILAGVLAGSNTRYTGLWAYYSNGKQEWNRE